MRRSVSFHCCLCLLERLKRAAIVRSRSSRVPFSFLNERLIGINPALVFVGELR